MMVPGRLQEAFSGEWPCFPCLQGKWVALVPPLSRFRDLVVAPPSWDSHSCATFFSLNLGVGAFLGSGNFAPSEAQCSEG
jgi:hypothetical protein